MSERVLIDKSKILASITCPLEVALAKEKALAFSRF